MLLKTVSDPFYLSQQLFGLLSSEGRKVTVDTVKSLGTEIYNFNTIMVINTNEEITRITFEGLDSDLPYSVSILVKDNTIDIDTQSSQIIRVVQAIAE